MKIKNIGIIGLVGSMTLINQCSTAMDRMSNEAKQIIRRLIEEGNEGMNSYYDESPGLEDIDRMIINLSSSDNAKVTEGLTELGEKIDPLVKYGLITEKEGERLKNELRSNEYIRRYIERGNIETSVPIRKLPETKLDELRQQGMLFAGDDEVQITWKSKMDKDNRNWDNARIIIQPDQMSRNKLRRIIEQSGIGITKGDKITEEMVERIKEDWGQHDRSKDALIQIINRITQTPLNSRSIEAKLLIEHLAWNTEYPKEIIEQISKTNATINPDLSARENIVRICDKEGIDLKEYSYLNTDEIRDMCLHEIHITRGEVPTRYLIDYIIHKANESNYRTKHQIEEIIDRIKSTKLNANTEESKVLLRYLIERTGLSPELSEKLSNAADLIKEDETAQENITRILNLDNKDKTKLQAGKKYNTTENEISLNNEGSDLSLRKEIQRLQEENKQYKDRITNLEKTVDTLIHELKKIKLTIAQIQADPDNKFNEEQDDD